MSFFVENPDDNLKYSKQFYSLNKRTLCVNWVEENNLSILTCTIIAPNSNSEHGAIGRTRGLSRQRIINEISNNLDSFFKEVTKKANPPANLWKSFLINLRSRSKRLFEQIIPDTIKSYLNQWDEGFWVEIVTDENWIPWELLHDDARFWGEKFVITRRICSKKRVSSEAPENGHIEKILNIVGGAVNNDSAREFFENLPSSFTAAVTLLEECPVSDLSDCLTREQVDVIHFTCHGLIDPMRLQIDGSNSNATNLCLETVGELDLKLGILVFANACNSASNFRLFGENTNFGSVFCEQGANVFIGTLGPIPTRYAIDFARDIYTELFLQNDGDTNDRSIGYAMAIAKKKASRRSNLFWLLYCMYGNPNYCIQESSA